MPHIGHDAERKNQQIQFIKHQDGRQSMNIMLEECQAMDRNENCTVI